LRNLASEVELATVTRKIFISGPIQGMEKQQSYRTKIKQICIRCGFEPIDPWQREKILYRDTRPGWWNNVPAASFIQRDLQDIDKSNLLVAYLPKLSAGTCMELFYAKTKGKKTICICQLNQPSPWITHHSDITINTIKELETILEEELGPTHLTHPRRKEK
jgi:nucleoside 2-deoxyribosyltransferase